MAPTRHGAGHTDAMLQRDSNRRSNMERANEKSIELTEKELDAVTGGKLGNGTLPFNPFHPVPNVKVH
jgi:bacteriocin-like protein